MIRNEKGLHFIDAGKGDIALVFLHYFGGSGKTWDKVIVELSQTFRCIAIDLPGFGDSQATLPEISVSAFARDVAQLLSILALKKYVLIGHSMGGKIAMSLASLKPFGLISLILIAPSPPTPEPIKDNERKELLEAYGDRYALKKLLKNVTARSLVNSDIENVVADNLRASHTSWNWWVTLGSREDISARISSVLVPVLIVSGALDQKFSTHFLRAEMINYYPSATYIEIPEAAHLVPLENPSALASSIEHFVNVYFFKGTNNLKGAINHG